MELVIKDLESEVKRCEEQYKVYSESPMKEVAKGIAERIMQFKKAISILKETSIF